VDISVELDPDPDDLDLIEAGVRRAADAATRLPPDQDLAVFVRVDGQILAGLTGWTWGDCCELQNLWVADDLRGRGLGTALMEAAENEARQRGCTTIVIFAHSFQPHELYSRLGYDVVARIGDFPTGSDALWMVKRLDAAE
jgi:GNAT superfamily N-acetyltransferase